MYEHVVRRLQESKGGRPTIARETGLSLRTISKIARREISDPGVSQIERLHQYFLSRDMTKCSKAHGREIV
jgi:transcriptional regulator with XRE-family HTH domain